MNIRQLNRRVQIWAGSTGSDGFGGTTALENIVTTVWAKITSVSGSGGAASRYKDLGLDNLQNSFIFTMRRRNDFNLAGNNLFLKYKGDRYFITSAQDEDIEKNFITLVATKERTAAVIAAPDGASFPYVFPMTLG